MSAWQGPWRSRAPRGVMPRGRAAFAFASIASVTLAACGGSPNPPPGVPAPLGAGPGTICNFAGNGDPAFTGEGEPALTTSLYWPIDLQFAPDGRAYILDWQNHRVRRIDADG